MVYDFLIIGGGIAGISAAARLAPMGSTLLLEAEEHFAYHASGRSAALYEPRYGNPAVVALSMASNAFFQASGTLSPRGLMFLDGPDHAERFAGNVTAFALDPLSVDEARQIVPILNPETVGFAAYASHAWDIDTDLLIQHFLREARSHGAETRSRAPVRAIRRGAAGWAVETPDAIYETRLLINAAGAWADPVAQLAGHTALRIQPYRRSMARLPAPSNHDVSGWPMIIGGAEDWYAKPDAGALLVSPADEDPILPQDAYAEDMVLAEGLARYEEMVTSPVTRLLSNWAGLRSFAPDRVPVIGFATDDPTFFWLAGQGGYGFQSSPAASQLVADLIGGRASDIDSGTIAALSPGRFA